MIILQINNQKKKVKLDWKIIIFALSVISLILLKKKIDLDLVDTYKPIYKIISQK